MNFSLLEQRITLCLLCMLSFFFMIDLLNLFCIINYFLLFYRFYTQQENMKYLCIHKDKLQLEPDNTGTMGPYPVPLIFKRNVD
jgi:hypothetical protein